MWFKPKGWKDLSEEDQAWLKGAKRLSTVQKLHACVMDNKPERILFLLKAHSFSRPEYYRAARLAVISQKPEALQAILDQNQGFNFADSGDGDRAAAGRLFATVGPDAFPLWKILYDANQKGNYGQLDETDIIDSMPEGFPHDFLRFHLDQADPSRTGVFRACLGKVLPLPAEKLKFVLGWASKFPGAQKALDKALAYAAETGDTEKVALLLEKRANPGSAGGEALLRAAENGHRAVVELLLPRMDLETCGESLLSEAKEKRLDPQSMEWLEKAVDQACTAARSLKNQENFMLIDPETLAETKQLPGELKLTVLFNFRSRQQTTIAEKRGEAPSLAVAVTDFSDIGDHDFLEAMRQKLVALGGKAEPFTRLPKPGLSRG